jgi:hypothetical protein
MHPIFVLLPWTTDNNKIKLLYKYILSKNMNFSPILSCFNIKSWLGWFMIMCIYLLEEILSHY